MEVHRYRNRIAESNGKLFVVNSEKTESESTVHEDHTSDNWTMTTDSKYA